MQKSLETLPIWFEQGNCSNLGIDAGIMVPEFEDEQAEAVAKSVCLNCDINELCLGWAMKNRRNDLGVYGGQTSHERQNRVRAIQREKRRHGKT